METIKQHIYTRGINGFGTTAASGGLSPDAVFKLEKLQGCAATASYEESILFTVLDSERVFFRSVWKSEGNGANDPRPHPFSHTYLLSEGAARRELSDPYAFFCRTTFESRYDPRLVMGDLAECPRETAPRESAREWSYPFLYALAGRILSGKRTVIPLRGETVRLNSDALALMARASRAIPHFLTPYISFLSPLSPQTKLPTEKGWVKPFVYFTHNLNENETYNLAYARYEAEILDPERPGNGGDDPLTALVAAAMRSDEKLSVSADDERHLEIAFEDGLALAAVGLLLAIVVKTRNGGGVSELTELIRRADQIIGPDWENRYVGADVRLALRDHLAARPVNGWSPGDVSAENMAYQFACELDKKIDWGAGYLDEEKVAGILTYRNELLMLNYRRFALSDSEDDRREILRWVYAERPATVKLHEPKIYKAFIYEGLNRIETVDKVSLARFIAFFTDAIDDSYETVQTFKKVFSLLTDDEITELLERGERLYSPVVYNLCLTKLDPHIVANRALQAEEFPQWFLNLSDETVFFLYAKGNYDFAELPKARMRHPGSRKILLSLAETDAQRHGVYQAAANLIVVESDPVARAAILRDVLTNMAGLPPELIRREFERFGEYVFRYLGDIWFGVVKEAIRGDPRLETLFGERPPDAPPPAEEEKEVPPPAFMDKVNADYPQTQEGRRRLRGDIRAALSSIFWKKTPPVCFVYCLAACLPFGFQRKEDYCAIVAANWSQFSPLLKKSVRKILREKKKELGRGP